MPNNTNQPRYEMDMSNFEERNLESLLDDLAEHFRTDLKDPKRVKAEFERMVTRLATEGVVLPIESAPQDKAR